MSRWHPARSIAVALAALGLLLAACGGGDDAAEAPPTGALLADRWLRVGEDPRTGVTVYEGGVYPGLAALLNPGMTADTPEDDLLALRVHPDGTLLGSFHLQRPDGAELVWLVLDVPGADRAVAETIERQLDESPWQVIGGQATEAYTVLRFQSTTSGDVTGTAVIQVLPGADPLAVTIERDGAEETLSVERAAPVPRLAATLEEADGAVVARAVFSGAAALAGLQAGDRIVAVDDRPVATLAELDAALRVPPAVERATVVYILEVQNGPAPDEADEAFVMPSSRPLPADFPLAFLVRDGDVALEVSWTTQPEGRFYQVTLLTDQPTIAVADAYRAALEAEGWEITDDRALGFATVLEFSRDDGAIAGQLQVDAFERDDALTAMQVQVQVSRGSGE